MHVEYLPTPCITRFQNAKWKATITWFFIALELTSTHEVYDACHTRICAVRAGIGTFETITYSGNFAYNELCQRQNPGAINCIRGFELVAMRQLTRTFFCCCCMEFAV